MLRQGSFFGGSCGNPPKKGTRSREVGVRSINPKAIDSPYQGPNADCLPSSEQGLHGRSPKHHCPPNQLPHVDCITTCCVSAPTCRFCLSMASVTSDQGVEAAIGDCPRAVLDACPSALHSSSLLIDIDAGEGGDSGLADDLPLPGSTSDQDVVAAWEASKHVFPNSLSVVGTLHIAGNLVEKFSELAVWSWFEPLLTSLSQFLHSPNNRKRIIRTCCPAGSPHAMFATCLQKRFPKMVQWRWGVLIAVLRSLEQSQTMLTSCFTLDKYLQDASEAASRVKLEKVEEAISSPRFWSCVHMFLGLQAVLESFSSWSEGTPTWKLGNRVEIQALFET